MANSTADGSVVISVDMDVSDAEKELSRLKSSIIKMETDLKIKSNEKGILQKQLEGAKRELDALKSSGKIIGDKLEFDPGVIEKMDELNSTISDTEKKIAEIDKSVSKTNTTLEATKTTYGVIAQEAEKLRKEQEATAESEENYDAKLQTAKESILIGIKGMADGAKNAARAIMPLFKKIPSLLNSAISKSAKFAKEAGKTILSAVKNMNVFSKLSDGLSQKFKRLGSTIKQALVFSVIYKGLATVREQMGAYLTVNTQFSTALRQLQGVLLTAFQPIYDTVLPALTALANGLAQAIAVVSQFTARLFGTTAKQSQKSAEALYNEANALKVTGEAADEAAGSLAGFDEINTIQTEKQSSGGGGTAADTGPLFDYEYEDQPFDSWGEAFSGFLDKMLNGIPVLRESLLDFADWLNGFTKKLYDMFTFPGVLEKVKQLGSDLANALNGMVSSINWYQLGQSLGAGMNLALQFLVNLIYGFDWINLGSSLAAMVNGAVSEIDWYAVGQLLWAGFKIAIETLAGFLLGLDMVQLAEAASNLAIGFFDSVTETLASIDWEQIGIQLATFLANIDWAGVAESCFTAIGAAFAAATLFLWGLIKDAWSEVVNWWHDVAYEDGKFTLQGLLEGILDVMKSIGIWIKEHIFDPFVNGFKRVFGIHSPSTVMAELGRYIMQGLLNGLSSKFSDIKNALIGLWNDVKKWWNSSDGPKKFLTLEYWNGLGKDIIDGFLSGLKSAWDGLTSWFNGVWNDLFGNRKVSVDVNRGGNFGSTSSGSFGGSRMAAQSLPSIAPVNIPALAKGAVIPPNREFMAVLGDQRSGTNIEAPLETIKQALAEVMQSNNSGGEIVINITNTLDGKVVARNTVRHINDMTRQAGKPVLLI